MSGFAGVCQLIAEVREQDEYGVIQTSERRRRVRCNVYSTGAAAYYSAFAAGVKVEAVLQLRRAAYREERLCEYGGRVLAVSRVDGSSPDFVRLTLTERVGDR